MFVYILQITYVGRTKGKQVKGKGGTRQNEKEALNSLKHSQIVASRDTDLSVLKQEMCIHLVPSLGIFEKEKNQKLLSFTFL